MTSNRTQLARALLVGCLAFVTAYARATERHFTDATADHKWSTANNWNPSGVPTDGDHAVIDSNKLCNVDILNARADSFEVVTTARLVILGSGALEMDSNSSIADAGGVQLNQGAELLISGSLTLSGNGSLRGLRTTATIKFTGNYDLANTSTIEGAMIIQHQSTGRFRLINDGLVHANADEGQSQSDRTLLLTEGTFRGSGEYKVSHDSRCKLEFAGGVIDTGLAADFTVEAGTLAINEDITTTGHLTFTGGTIVVDDNDAFTAGSP